MVTYGKIIDKNKPKKATHFMLLSKVFLVLAMCVYYAMEVMIFVPILGIMNSIQTFDFNWPLIGFLLVVAFALGITALVMAILGAAKKEKDNTMVTIVLKTLMIPFFAINLYCWFCLVSGLMNPFLFIAIPGVVIIGVAVTYIIMLTTSLPEIVYMIIFMIRQKKSPKKQMVGGIFLCFCFFLDLVGIVLVHRSYKEIIESNDF